MSDIQKGSPLTFHNEKVFAYEMENGRFVIVRETLIEYYGYERYVLNTRDRMTHCSSISMDVLAHKEDIMWFDSLDEAHEYMVWWKLGN